MMLQETNVSITALADDPLMQLTPGETHDSHAHASLPNSIINHKTNTAPHTVSETIPSPNKSVAPSPPQSQLYTPDLTP